jgi:four helix bundle protein
MAYCGVHSESERAVQSYRDLRVWQRAVELVDKVYALSDKFPPEERFALASQLRRAAISVAANIAEGHARSTTGEFSNQLSVARGSAAEVEALLIISERRSYAEAPEYHAAREDCDAVMRMITVLKRKLRRVSRIRS